MADRFQIRRAAAVDARAIAETNVVAWRESYGGIVPREFLDGRKVGDRAAFWRRTLSEKCVDAFLAFDDKHGPVGYVVGGPRRDGPADCPGEIYSIYVLERGKGRGLGRSGPLVRALGSAGGRRPYASRA
mgnify:CR=1 FL=1